MKCVQLFVSFKIKYFLQFREYVDESKGIAETCLSPSSLLFQWKEYAASTAGTNILSNMTADHIVNV